jgi:hypothetical protein
MAEALLVVARNELARVSVASVPTTFPATVPTTTAPTTGTLGLAYQQGNRSLVLMPWVNASTVQTYGMRLIAWSQYTATSGSVWYLPSIIANVTLATPSAAYSIDGTNDFYGFATITDSSASNPTISLKPDIYSPGTASGGPASLAVQPVGALILQLQFTAPAGTPTLGCMFRTF